MGQTLEKPAVEKHFDSGSGNNLRFAACGMQGWRLDMEDAHTAVMSLGNEFNNVSFYAVFDGHAGSYTSRVASEELCIHIGEIFRTRDITRVPESIDSDEMEQFKQAIIESFITFDDKLKESEPYKSLRETCGSTALAVLITSNFIIFCNCGDSRGLLARSDNVEFHTQDHKPSDPLEKSRIEKSGGCVIMERVNGNLAVSRALGDFSFKDKSELATKEQAVSPEPTVTIIPRSPEHDQFIVLACDGIWDVMSCEEVRKFVHTKLLVTDDLQLICADLIDNCLMKDSRDNMTALIVAFPAAAKVCPMEQKKDQEYEQNIREKVEEIMQSQGPNVPLITVLNTLTEHDLSPPDCASSLLEIYSKKRFVENVMNTIDPTRETDRDYSTVTNLSSFPIALQTIQQLVKPDPTDKSSDSLIQSPNPNSLESSSDVESDISPTNEQ